MRDRRGRAERAMRVPGADIANQSVRPTDGLETVEHGDSRWVLDAGNCRFARLPREGAELSMLTLPWSRCSRIERLSDGSIVIELDAAGHTRIRLDASAPRVPVVPLETT